MSDTKVNGKPLTVPTVLIGLVLGLAVVATAYGLASGDFSLVVDAVIFAVVTWAGWQLFTRWQRRRRSGSAE